MIFRAKVIRGKKLLVEDISEIKIWAANRLLHGYTPIRSVPFRMDEVINQSPERDCPIEGHDWIDLQRYEMQDFLRDNEIYYVVAHSENSSKSYILKRASRKKCEKYKRKIERRQARKSSFDTYEPIIKIGAIIFAAVITGLITVTLTKC